jgi:hypothetical protein
LSECGSGSRRYTLRLKTYKSNKLTLEVGHGRNLKSIVEVEYQSNSISKKNPEKFKSFAIENGKAVYFS